MDVTRFANRVDWTKTHLQKEGPVKSVGRGRSRITSVGSQILEDPPGKLDSTFFSRFEGYAAFLLLRSRGTPLLRWNHQATGTAQREVMSAMHEMLCKQLAQELLDGIKSCSPAFLERLVVEVIVALGYGDSLSDMLGKAMG